MKLTLNLEQRKVLAMFFINLAVAWFVAAFVTPRIAADFTPLTLVTYFGNMMGALVLALSLLKEGYE